MSGAGGCTHLVFYDAESLAIARTDGTVTALMLGREIERWRFRMRRYGEDVLWEPPAEWTLGSQGERIERIGVSPDGRWIVTTGRDQVVRLWSPFEFDVLAAARFRAIEAVGFSRDSRSVITVEKAAGRGPGSLGASSSRTGTATPHGSTPRRVCVSFRSGMHRRPCAEYKTCSPAFKGLRAAFPSPQAISPQRPGAASARSGTATDGSSYRRGCGSPAASHTGRVDRAVPDRWIAQTVPDANALEILERSPGTRRMRLVFSPSEGEALFSAGAPYPRASPNGAVIAFVCGANKPTLCIVDTRLPAVRTVSLEDNREPYELADDGTVILAGDENVVIDSPVRGTPRSSRPPERNPP